MNPRGLSILIGVVALTALASNASGASWFLGPEQLVQAGGADLAVTGYSVPSLADWNEDGRLDLIVGEGSGVYAAYTRVYLNIGTAEAPAFGGYDYARYFGFPITESGSGCMGMFPRVVQWDDDGKKDLLVGLANGTAKVYLNTNTNADPQFGMPLYVKYGDPEVDVQETARATVDYVDWDDDGDKDLLVGSLSATVAVFDNIAGPGTTPDFDSRDTVDYGASELTVPGSRSSPCFVDVSGDGLKDLVSGNTNGEIVLYENGGTAGTPSFNSMEYLYADGVKIDLSSSRSRPCVDDFDSDGVLDLLIGASDGKVHLYLGRMGGDCNENDVVDDNDLSLLLSNWEQAGGWAVGNFNADAAVDDSDLSIMLANWSYVPAPALVPEPATLLLLAVGAAVMRRRG